MKPLLRYGTDYNQVRHEHTIVSEFFEPLVFQERTFDFATGLRLRGRRGPADVFFLRSALGHPNHEPMLRELRRIFDLHQHAGRVIIEYATRMFYGQLA